MTQLVVRNTDLGADRVGDVRLSSDHIVAVGPSLEVRGTDEVLDARGAGVIPGLHDHHLHLYGWAAARDSLVLGPPDVADRGAFETALSDADRRLPPESWLRGVGYHESVAGSLDRGVLDDLVPTRPVRIQHRSGIRWVLNSAALERLPPELLQGSGVERDPSGRPTGPLTRMDERLRDVWPSTELDFAGVSMLALGWGVTGFTDATPFTAQCQLDPLGEAVARGDVLQRVTVMSGPGAHVVPPRGVGLGPVKVLLDDVTLPGSDELQTVVEEAHRGARSVAVHCVTRLQSVLATSVFVEAGAAPGDRIEHGGIIGPELVRELARLPITVVTNPGFILQRGDAYLEDVPPQDREDLYRCGSLRRSGVALAAGTDAPFGLADPWQVVRAAATRETSRGVVLGREEALSPEEALSLFFGGENLANRARSVAPGQPSDLVVLTAPLREALKTNTGDSVAACIIGGRVVLDRR